eukprot:CAMPEP_0183375070 /NCGR_PEP_ID=MMETSP0164_2-20130417/116338_1 /TAXON_ID=221442 /ORGANISM="Coccolithus pelagicus ssp braarudi, Strain PLY182g" /LENGTH=69 /DNA_ID=CAMNT_0025552185 /DNA_START=131 /DNA_END=338 /DNA_ORIENTATION=+
MSILTASRRRVRPNGNQHILSLQPAEQLLHSWIVEEMRRRQNMPVPRHDAARAEGDGVAAHVILSVPQQ